VVCGSGLEKSNYENYTEKKISKSKLEEHIMHTCNVSLLSLVMPAFSFKPYTSGEVCIGRFWIKRMAPSWSLSSGI
jgi:hypothetical protein